jgi:hypothetical protein
VGTGVQSPAAKFEQAFRNIDDVLRKEAGCTTELDYTEQTSWLLFLKCLDNASVSLRKHLLESCNLHTVLDCPSGTFQGAGVKTVVLFLDKGSPTRKVWFYQLDPGRSLGKTNPLNDDDLAEFVKLQKSKAPERPVAGASGGEKSLAPSGPSKASTGREQRSGP